MTGPEEPVLNCAEAATFAEPDQIEENDILTRSRRPGDVLACPSGEMRLRGEPAVPAEASALALSGVVAGFGRTRVLDGLDLELGRGESLGVRGANGSGKSTLLRVCASLLRPSTGWVRILGVDRDEACVPTRRRQICLVGHEHALYPQLSVRENLRFVGRLYDRPDDAVEEVLDVVGLGRVGERRVDRCSQGMVRRADLARVLLTQPRLLLLDEASAGLDPAADVLVDHVIRQTCSVGGAAVVISHDHGWLSGQVDRTATLRSGRLVLEGTP